ncbi:decaprenyl-phosphate phosphoribosyltransferase, partial [Clostridium sporogenes]
MDIKGIIALMRPKQWIKNFFVFAAIIFSGNLINEGILKNNIITFVLFCLTSSTIYILNDIVDLEKDKRHPEKKNRPLPSGRVSKTTAIIMNIVILFTVLFCSYKFVDYKIMYIYLL